LEGRSGLSHLPCPDGHRFLNSLTSLLHQSDRASGHKYQGVPHHSARIALWPHQARRFFAENERRDPIYSCFVLVSPYKFSTPTNAPKAGKPRATRRKVIGKTLKMET
jgi:hypothetical protein